eukprot:TRINITY_DN46380_c0_g1_i1.p1 TRINITY_DN46380_c0_g1~~TRINITY_DN46380_c0_g1_i1.p1  ORF type:complete len:330 (-),score=18.46 TRINITY_DN46380_c0_g1_i1:109-1017(-)
MGGNQAKPPPPEPQPPPPPTQPQRAIVNPLGCCTVQQLPARYDELKKSINQKRQYHAKEYHVAVLGPRAAGKSTLINSIVSSWEGMVITVEKTMVRTEHVTTEYKSYKVACDHEQMIFFHSLEGFCQNEDGKELDGDYMRKLELLCGGFLPLGIKKGADVPMGPLDRQGPPLDAIILVWGVDSFEQHELQLLKTVITRLRRQNKEPNQPALSAYVALTKLDTLEKDADNVEALFRSTKVQKEIGEVKNTLGVSRAELFPCVSHQDFNSNNNSAEPDLAVSVLHLQLVERVLREAEIRAKVTI